MRLNVSEAVHWVQITGKKGRYVRKGGFMSQFSGGIRYISEVHSQRLFCRNGAIIQVTRGRNQIKCKKSRKLNKYMLFLNDKPLHWDCADECGSSEDMIQMGYGEGLKGEQAVENQRELLNGDFKNLQTFMEGIYPILNLFSNGMYFIADFDLFPVQRVNWVDDRFPGSGAYSELRCFWNYIDKEIGSYSPFEEESERVGYEYVINHYPFYLIPTQKAKSMNPERVEFYMRRLRQEENEFPRAVSLYLKGSANLLLDGHHKALASAALGIPAKSIVIFKIDGEKNLLLAASEKRRLYFRNCGIEGMHICDGDGNCLSNILDLEDFNAEESEEPEYFIPPTPEEWGEIPPRWISEMKNPAQENNRILRDGTDISIGEIKKTITRLQKKSIEDLRCSTEDMKQIKRLQTYLKLDPESKWVTPPQRRWLDEVAGFCHL